MLLWFGHESDAPACPENAAGVAYEGHADAGGPLTCGACTCTPPAGTCGLPVSITANAGSCAAGPDAGSPAPFDAPAGWDGGCTAYDGIDAGVASLTTAPLTLNESGCTPLQGPPGPTPDLWSTFARACVSSAGGSCASTGETCSPAASSGFRQCVFFLAEGDVACPSASFSPYTEQHTFFASADDTRECSPCTCASAPGTCSTELWVYANSMCSGKPADIILASAMPPCSDIPGPPLPTLGSKSSRPATYTPGTCQPGGGVPLGVVVPLMPVTFCCLPSP